MKRKLGLIIIAFLSSFTLLHAQSGKDSERYVFVISKINYLKAIEDALSASKDRGLKVSEMKVILCGESVKAFQEENPLIKKALGEEKISVYACGLSLEQMNVDPKILPANVTIVRNGILEAMVLQKKGYIKFDL